MANTPKYDNDYVTLGYLKKSISSESDEQSKKIETIPKNYNSPPIPPYYVGSLLIINGNIYRCIKSRLVGSFNMSDWQVVVSTEELDEALKFIYDINKLEYNEQVDGVIETFYQDDDPSINWNTNLDKEQHVSDLWTTDLDMYYQYEKKATNPVTYAWRKVNVPSTLFDIFDGYKRIFTSEPSIYSKDDLWLGSITKVAIKSSDTFNIDDWEERDDFIESSKVDQEEYHKIYLLPKITEINRQSTAEIKKAIDEITFTVSQIYETKTQVEKYIDDVMTEVAKEYTTKEEMNAQFSITSTQINSIVEKNTTQDNQIKFLNQEYTVIKQESDEISATVANQNNKISEVTQTVEELNSKISDIADITTSVEDTDAQVELNNINQSEPIRLVIRPIIDNISYLYPNIDLYPSEFLFSKVRTVRFNNITTGEYFDYELPDDLLYYDNENYDEFILDYDGQSCIINKRVGYNADGTTYVLTTPTTYSYEYPLIELTSGDYAVSVLGYDSAYIFARLMAQNIYTTQFATRAEVKSEVSQKANEITSTVAGIYETKNDALNQYTMLKQTDNSIATEVSKKVGNNEVISTINQSAEAVLIDAGKISLQGIVNMINEGSTTTINGNRITTGSITASQVAADIITTSNFSAQSINADRITSGTISTQRLSSDVITTSNFSAQSINADKITSGTISTNRLSTDVITTSNFNAQSISASNITSGTLSADRINGGTISASTIRLRNVVLGTGSSTIGGWTINSSSFSSGDSTINANGEIYFYPQISNGGILALNNGFRCKGPAGIAIYNNLPNYGSSNTINAGISIMGDSGNVVIGNRSSSYGVNIRSYISESTISNATNGAMQLASADYLRLYSNNSNIYMDAYNGAVWANGNGKGNSKVKTDAGSSSSRNVKENFREFDLDKYSKALCLLDKIKLYNYDYKYNVYKNPHQFGFIIDELESLEETSDFFEFEELNATVKGNIIDFSGTMQGNKLKTKVYDSDVLDKYLLTVCKAMYMRIRNLEEMLYVN